MMSAGFKALATAPQEQDMCCRGLKIAGRKVMLTTNVALWGFWCQVVTSHSEALVTLVPVAPVMCTRSEPARSTRFSLPTRTVWRTSPAAPPAPGWRPMPGAPSGGGQLGPSQGQCQYIIGVGCDSSRKTAFPCYKAMQRSMQAIGKIYRFLMPLLAPKRCPCERTRVESLEVRNLRATCSGGGSRRRHGALLDDDDEHRVAAAAELVQLRGARGALLRAALHQAIYLQYSGCSSGYWAQRSSWAGHAWLPLTDIPGRCVP